MNPKLLPVIGILLLLAMPPASASCASADLRCNQRQAAETADLLLRQGHVAWAVLWREQSAQMKVLADLVQSGKLSQQDVSAYSEFVLGDINRRVDACPNPKLTAPFC